MGLAGSKTDFGEGEMITPPRSGTHKRIIDQEFDPRSPSLGISRTPIVVEKTPEGLLDPRSPSAGIIRTPITTLTLPEKKITQDRVPLMPDLSDETNGVDDKLEDTDELLKEFDNLHHMSLAEKKINDDSLPFVYKDKVETAICRKPVKPTQPKQLFPNSKRHASLSKDITRSPLATRTVNMNSPQLILHNKQTKRVETAKSCVQEVIGSGRYCVQEKENVEY